MPRETSPSGHTMVARVGGCRGTRESTPVLCARPASRTIARTPPASREGQASELLGVQAQMQRPRPCGTRRCGRASSRASLRTGVASRPQSVRRPSGPRYSVIVQPDSRIAMPPDIGVLDAGAPSSPGNRLRRAKCRTADASPASQCLAADAPGCRCASRNRRNGRLTEGQTPFMLLLQSFATSWSRTAYFSHARFRPA